MIPSVFDSVPAARPVVGLCPAILLAAVLYLTACGGSGASMDAMRDFDMIVLDSVDTDPQIVGGMARVYELTGYPQDAQDANAYGTVWVSAVVTVRGRATRLRIAQEGHIALEREALNVVEQLDFEPARIDRGPVPATVEIPVSFPPPPPVAAE